jgi:hypothetical protein
MRVTQIVHTALKREEACAQVLAGRVMALAPPSAAAAAAAASLPNSKPQAEAEAKADAEAGAQAVRPRLNASSVSALESVSFGLRVIWPLNLLVTPDALARYNEILRFLLQIKRAQHSLLAITHATLHDKRQVATLNTLCGLIVR